MGRCRNLRSGREDGVVFLGATERTASSCPSRHWISFPVVESQILRVLSDDPLMIRFPSGE